MAPDASSDSNKISNESSAGSHFSSATSSSQGSHILAHPSENVPENELEPCLHTLEVDFAPPEFCFPGELFFHIPQECDLVVQFKSGDSERKIHLNTSLTPQEIAEVKEMRQRLIERGVKLDKFLHMSLTRYISRARGDIDRAIELILTTQQWRKDYFKQPLRSWDSELKRGLMKGVMYFCGRDKSMRPLMVVAAKRAPASWYKKPDFFIKLLIFHMEYLSRHFLVPGVVETLNVLIDLRGIDIWTFPISKLGQVYKVLSNHYLGRVQHFYILNAPRFLGAIMRFITKLLTDRQQQKLVFCADTEPLTKAHMPSQLEHHYGGTRLKIHTFPYSFAPGPFNEDHLPAEHSRIPDCARALGPDTWLSGKLLLEKRNADVSPQELIAWGPEHADVLREIRQERDHESARDVELVDGATSPSLMSAQSLSPDVSTHARHSGSPVASMESMSPAMSPQDAVIVRRPSFTSQQRNSRSSQAIGTEEDTADSGNERAVQDVVCGSYFCGFLRGSC